MGEEAYIKGPHVLGYRGKMLCDEAYILSCDYIPLTLSGDIEYRVVTEIERKHAHPAAVVQGGRV